MVQGTQYVYGSPSKSKTNVLAAALQARCKPEKHEEDFPFKKENNKKHHEKSEQEQH